MRHSTLYSLFCLFALCACSEEKAPYTPEPPPVATAAEEQEPMGDLVRGKMLAEGCVKCHELDGVKPGKGVPFIAGITQEYLIRSMLAYSNGSRDHAEMKQIVEEMEPDAIRDVSAYYASLSTPWRGGEIHAALPLAYDRAAVARGREAAASCDACHGPEHRLGKSDVPNLAGMQPDYFLPALRSYFSGERNDRFMSLLEYQINEKNVRDMAAYYAAQPPMRPAVLTPQATAQGRRLAMSCAGCHGSDGNSPNPKIPSLAGQPADYLFKASMDYQYGLRGNELMRKAVAGLDETAIRAIAIYYAEQQPDSRLFYVRDASKHFDPIGDGARIASACNGCHGEEGNSRVSSVPSLSGLHVKYLYTATQAYRQGQRAHKTMQTMVDFLDDVGIEKVAFYYATRKPQQHKKIKPGERAKGEALSEKCVSCHGEGGVSEKPEVPSLAGQDRNYLIKATREYAIKKRQHDGMLTAVEKMPLDEIMALADYYANQAAQPVAAVYPPEPTAKLITERCVKCHGERGFSNEFDKPRLAGQSERYLIDSMLQYADGRRNHHAMVAMSEVLSLIEIKGIAAYYARQHKK
ncbi:MAG: c-type cytochrome [Gammaproteobacteria bacterium]|nr:c-type cytochrome [Gammaproteobacteria bacterium]